MDVRHLSTGGGYLRDDRSLGSKVVKVKTCTISPNEILWIAVVSDRDVARHCGHRKRAGLKIDEQRDDGKSQAAASGRPGFPSKVTGFGN